MPGYNPNIPAANDLLSADQGPMQENFQSIQTLIDIDHVDFVQGQFGQHKQVNLSIDQAATPLAGAKGVLYANTDTQTSLSQVFYQPAGTSIPFLMLSAIKAFGSFQGSTSGTSTICAFNAAASVTSGSYTITLNAGVLSNTNAVVIISVTGNAQNLSYHLVDEKHISITINTNPITINYVILQP